MKNNLLKLTILLGLLFQALITESQEMQIGMGLSGLNYYQTQHPFVDVEMASDKWKTYTGGEWDTKVADELELDSCGYPLYVPFPTSKGEQKVRKLFATEGDLPIDTLVFLYEGEGKFSFSGLDIIEESEGRILLKKNADRTWISIDSSYAYNHLRNFHLVFKEFEHNYETDFLNPEFFLKQQPFLLARFMDMFATNSHMSPGVPSSTLPPFHPDQEAFLAKIDWDKAPKTCWHTQADNRGLSYQLAAQMVNALNQDTWVCVPHNASDEYIRQMALVFKETLEPDRKVYLEFSNEVWNWMFDQTHYFDKHPDYANMIQPHAVATRTNEAFKIWRDAWGEEAYRVRRVIASQGGNSWQTKKRIEIIGNGYDYIAITHYIGGIEDSVNALDPTSPTLAQEYADLSRDYFLTNNWPKFKTHVELAAEENRPLITYEGGTHMIHSDKIVAILLDSLIVAEQSQPISDLLQEFYDSMATNGVEIITPFVLAGRPTKWGHWGHLHNIYENPADMPQYQGLIDNLPSSPITDVAKPSKPTGLSETFAASSYCNIMWNSSTDNKWVSGYYIYLDDSFNGVTSDTTYKISNLQESTSYSVTIKAFDIEGNFSDISNPLTISTLAVDTIPPTMPDSVNVETGLTELTLTWESATDNFLTEGYSIYDKNGDIIETTTDTTVNFKFLFENTLYEYCIKAFDGAGNYSDCKFVSALTLSKTGYIVKTNTTPVIDGTIDAMWSSLNNFEIDNAFNNTWYSNNDSDLGGYAKAAWDNHNLYFLVHITDDILKKDSDKIYDDDGIEIYLDLNNDKGMAYDGDDRMIRVRWDDSLVYNSAQNEITFVNMKQSTNDSGYIVEFEIPFDSILNGFTPSTGWKIGFDVHVNEDDGNASGKRTSKHSWYAEVDYLYQVPYWFGTASLQETLKMEQEIVFSYLSNIDIQNDTTINLSAFSTSGLNVTFEVLQGSGAITNNQLTISSSFTGKITIKAMQAGNASYYEAEPKLQAFDVNVENTYSTLNNKIKVKENMKCFPNPFENTFYVKTKNVSSINIYNINGVLVKSVSANNTDGITEVNLSEMPAGIYLVMVGNQVQKVIKK